MKKDDSYPFDFNKCDYYESSKQSSTDHCFYQST